MTNTQFFAKRELEILAKTQKEESLILPFKDEILQLCEKFGNSGQSGGSAPYVASALSKAIKNLLLQEPISDITGNKVEWLYVSEMCEGNAMFQNKRCYALFKDGKNKRAYYLDAIKWKNANDDEDIFTGRVYIDDSFKEIITSSQYVKFPFKPKSFYIDVVNVIIDEDYAINNDLNYFKNKNGECYYVKVKNIYDLNKVFKYYLKK